ncbi:hypothetical protein [Hymenobacter armeniacus]|uniref:DUF304 domain-containing protein n=1 Tax=Hymenobacter armeniacus TaxID=2771358 RepID=A0ABR8JVQ8_9BACT|nr:hypothetical protein [Hymenobacter armeniacus]MBD2721824.1 hypothetical protein [Hymenobacter armeniacus]
MSQYAFETPEFGLDEQGLHRLRSRFAFEHIGYSELREANVTRGKSVQNWVVLLVVGLLCLGFSVFTANRLLMFLLYGRGHFYVETLVTPLIPGAIGIAAIWQALRVTDILVVRTGRRRLVFPLDTLKEGRDAMALASYLAKRVPRQMQRLNQPFQQIGRP